MNRMLRQELAPPILPSRRLAALESTTIFRDATRRGRARQDGAAARGFSLIEALIATIVMMVVTAAATQLIVMSRRATQSALTTSLAATLAEQKMEQLRALQWGFDLAGNAVADVSSDVTIVPQGGRGVGLAVSPPDSLTRN